MLIFRMFMNADDGAGGGAGAEGGEVAKKKEGEGAAAGADLKPKEGEPAKEEPKFTQKQLNDLIAMESGKKATKATKDLMEKMGFKTIEEVEEFAKSRKESMTKEEKLAAQIAEHATKTQTAEAERDEARAELAALKAGVPEDKIAKVVKLAAGYDGETITDKIGALLLDFPDLAKGKVGAGRDVGRMSGQQGVSDEERLLAVARENLGLTKK